jgi:hypothetical protein
MTQIKIIPLWPKSTQANTQYWAMEPEDRAWLLEHMMRFLAEMAEVMTHEAEMAREMLRRRPTGYPRGRQGPNSHASMLGGIVLTLLDGRDLSTPTLDAVEALTDIMAHYTDQPRVQFQRGLWSRA